MDWSLNRVSDPASKPVSVSEVKDQSRIETTAEDTLVERLIDAATASIDGPYGIGICMVSQQWEWAMDRFPLRFEIPLYPVISVDSIKYTDEDGVEQTLDASVYRVDTHSNPARITLAWNQTWPSARLVSNAVKVTFTAGYSSVPEDLKHAVIMLVAHWYENREAVLVGSVATPMPMAVDAILNRYRVPGVG